MFDALRALTVDVAGGRTPQHKMVNPIFDWLTANNRPVPPIGALNRILARAGYPRILHHYKNIELRTPNEK
ncbi:hypothetical protein [Streptomyces coelicoflavus]|uniref:hypothetical protein n=1 Tax=Streptomyces coelicoflavus TaxID=285562 RepID=UPI002E26A0A2